MVAWPEMCFILNDSSSNTVTSALPVVKSVPVVVDMFVFVQLSVEEVPESSCLYEALRLLFEVIQLRFGLVALRALVNEVYAFFSHDILLQSIITIFFRQICLFE